MRVRRGYLLLGLCGMGLLTFDHVQRLLYVTEAPVLASEFRQGDKGPLLQAVLVSGQGLDEAETATSRRDVARCTEALKQYHAGRLQITTLVPGRPDSTSERALELISTRNCDHLVIFMTGHGGGRNFGGVGGFNLTRDSYGKTYFENWTGDDAEAFRRTNAQRKKLKWFYSQRFGLLGVHKVL